MSSHARRKLDDEADMLAFQVLDDRAEADMFRALAAVPEDERPPMPPIPADISKLDPATVWPALTTPALLFLAKLADDAADCAQARINSIKNTPAHFRRGTR